MADATRARRKSAHRRGVWAEHVAALYLRLKGYRIIEMRYKTPAGEVDIMARKGAALVAVEVKMRGELAGALEAVTVRSQKRIEKATLHFLALHPEYADYNVRFDVIALRMSFPFFLTHLDNAWQARS